MNAEFLSDCILRVRDDSGTRPRFELAAPLKFYSAVMDRDVWVPQGFVTDGPSIPIVVMSLTGYPGIRAAIIHDWLVQQRAIPRETSDRVLLEALRTCGVSEPLALAMHEAVAAYTRSISPAPQTWDMPPGSAA